MERTFIALKPDAVQRGLIGDITARFERKGFKLIGLKMMQLILYVYLKLLNKSCLSDSC